MTCKDCIHYKVCCQKNLHVVTGMDFVYRYKYNHIERVCKDFKDRSRFVELPCNVGDTVYIALNGYGVLKDTVKEFRVTSRRIWIRPEKFGMDCLLENMAFLTHEEAEQALKEREK